jgi:hypothetical protein
MTSACAAPVSVSSIWAYLTSSWIELSRVVVVLNLGGTGIDLIKARNARHKETFGLKYVPAESRS